MTDSTDDIYVGYLPVPRAQRRWLRLLVPTLLWGLCSISALVALSFGDSGRGTWNTQDLARFDGFLSLEPYPVLRTSDGTAILLVEEGKVPPREGLERFVGSLIRVEGFEIRRGELRMLELAPRQSAIVSMGSRGGAAMGIEPQTLGESTLIGEIVDSKCFAGAMKPGRGIGHRACAALCVASGIPPVLIAEGQDGTERLLLIDESDGRANQMVLPFIGREVRVRGQRVRVGQLEYLRISTSDIEAR